MKTENLYICDYPYPAYTAVIKALREPECTSDLLITNSISGLDQLIAPLKKTGIFRNIYFYDDYLFRDVIRHIFPLSSTNNRISILKKILNLARGTLLIFKAQRLARNISLPLDLKKSSYNNIYYCDRMSTLMFYLNSNNIPYTAMEHGKNVWRTKKTIDHFQLRVFYFLEKLHISCGIGGYAKACRAILVYDREQVVKSPHQAEIIEWNIDRQIALLTEEEKDLVFQVYSNAYGLNLNYSTEYAILLTTPLHAGGILPTEEAQLHYYKDLVDARVPAGTALIVKPHPRDMADYSQVFFGAQIIKPVISAEVLSFSRDLRINCVLTVNSSSINAFSKKCSNLINLNLDGHSDEWLPYTKYI